MTAEPTLAQQYDPAPRDARRLFRYQVRYRRDEPSERVYRVTVTARNADDARRMAAIADPGFGCTTQTPRRMGEVLPPEGADPMTQAKALADLERGVAHFGRAER